jgi:hypothetical protein
MKATDKIDYLKSNNFSEWIDMRRAIFNELSDKQTMFCVCGKLATGLHEINCRKFNANVNSETVKRLEYLIQ